MGCFQGCWGFRKFIRVFLFMASSMSLCQFFCPKLFIMIVWSVCDLIFSPFCLPSYYPFCLPFFRLFSIISSTTVFLPSFHLSFRLSSTQTISTDCSFLSFPPFYPLFSLL